MNINGLAASIGVILILIGIFYLGYDRYSRIEAICSSHGLSVSSGHPDLCVNTQTGQVYASQYLKSKIP